MTSTSGRPPAGAAGPPTAISPLAQEVLSQLYQQSLEIDALVRLQSEKLRSGLDEARKKHCRALLSAVGQQVLRRVRDKEAELETATRRNAELEAKVRQIGAENQIWFNAARNNEALAASLRATHEQVLLQNAAAAAAGSAPQQREEGYGDSHGGPGAAAAAMFSADDAQSSCFDDSERERKAAAAEEEERRRRRACKVCLEGEVSVLLLPCRHLCLCKACESRLDACPICKSVKKASLQIFLS